MKFAIRLRAPHDRNGNPRRIYLVFDQHGGTVDVSTYDEGYFGWHAVPDHKEVTWTGTTIDVSAGEYRHWLKYGA